MREDFKNEGWRRQLYEKTTDAHIHVGYVTAGKSLLDKRWREEYRKENVVIHAPDRFCQFPKCREECVNENIDFCPKHLEIKVNQTVPRSWIFCPICSVLEGMCVSYFYTVYLQKSSIVAHDSKRLIDEASIIKINRAPGKTHLRYARGCVDHHEIMYGFMHLLQEARHTCYTEGRFIYRVEKNHVEEKCIVKFPEFLTRMPASRIPENVSEKCDEAGCHYASEPTAKKCHKHLSIKYALMCGLFKTCPFCEATNGTMRNVGILYNAKPGELSYRALLGCSDHHHNIIADLIKFLDESYSELEEQKKKLYIYEGRVDIRAVDRSRDVYGRFTFRS